jgi:hypothetical protein
VKNQVKKVIPYLRKGSRTLPELAKYLKIKMVDLEPILTHLGKHHPGVSRSGEEIFIDNVVLRGGDNLTFDLTGTEKHGRLGVVSCTHFGSKYMQLTYLNEFYEYCYKIGVDRMINLGDMTEGSGMVYRGQRYEMFLQGFTQQRDYAVENYPRIEGVSTDIIAGNHDDSFVKSADVDVVKEICNHKDRDDLNYCGRYAANILLCDGKVKTKLHHGEGGGSYAISYKVQKYIEAFTPEDKPQLYLLGHFHRVEQLFLRNVHAIQVGCFQAQTPYLVRKNLSPVIAGWVIDYDIAADGWSLGTVGVRLRPFYQAITDDYRNYPQ